MDAHEFGHAFGLKDMYASANDNNGYEPIANDELKYNKNTFGLPEGNGIMMYNGRAVTNDIEMIMLAFCENDCQYYVPHGKKQKCQKLLNVKRCLLMSRMMERFIFGIIPYINFKLNKYLEVVYENF